MTGVIVSGGNEDRCSGSFFSSCQVAEVAVVLSVEMERLSLAMGSLPVLASLWPKDYSRSRFNDV